MQPHAPYWGLRLNEGEKVSPNLLWGLADRHYQRYLDAEIIKAEEFKKAYLCNVRLVFYFVELLISFLPKPCIITADHGEALGEKGIIGHHQDVHKTREVPLVVIE